jgi:Flp pilus assembly protein TadD
MIYLVVMITSGLGILAMFGIRGTLRSRNVRRIARSVKNGFSSVEKRNAKLLPDTPAVKKHRSPRESAIALQKSRTLLREAERALMKQDTIAAERALIQALTIKPEDMDIKVSLARIYLESGRETKAEALYHDLVQTKESAALFGSLGLACYKQEKFLEACEAYRKALDLDPRNPERSYDLGRACIATRRFKEAVPLLHKAANALPRDLALLHLLAQCYMQISDLELAEEIYKRINKLDPRDEEVKARIGELAKLA